MAERTTSWDPVAHSRPTGIDEQLWPIVCATMVLVGILGVIICVNSDFEEERLLLNGYTYLAGLAVAAVLLIFIAAQLKGAVRRTAELAILLSLTLHAAGGVGAFYLFKSDLPGSSLLPAMHDSQSEADDESLPPDYHWAQDDEQQPQQAFEQTVSTTIREQARPAAQLQPRNMDRAMPATDLPRGPNAETTPLGMGGPLEPDGPVNVRRADDVRAKTSSRPRPWPWSGKKATTCRCPGPRPPCPSPCLWPQGTAQEPRTGRPSREDQQDRLGQRGPKSGRRQ